MKKLEKSVDIYMFVIIVVFVITLSFLNSNDRLSEFTFEFGVGDMYVNTRALYSGDDTKKAIKEIPDDHLTYSK